MTTGDAGKISHKDAALAFLRLVEARKIREAYATYASKEMRHHNPWFAGDAASLEKGMEEAHTRNPNTKVDVKRAIEEGNLVAVHSHVRMSPDNVDEPGFATVHIFRFEADRIVEMWDLAQPVPKESPNTNGMF